MVLLVGCLLAAVVGVGACAAVVGGCAAVVWLVLVAAVVGVAGCWWLLVVGCLR